MTARPVVRLRVLLALPLLALALVVTQQNQALALGAALHINGTTSATVVEGGTVELEWDTVDADTATAWTNQGGTPVSFPAWDGTKSVGPANSQSVTVNLPPGTYYLVIEASSGQSPAVSSVELIVTADDDDDDPVDPADPDDDPADPDVDPADAAAVPRSAPRAGQ